MSYALRFPSILRFGAGCRTELKLLLKSFKRIVLVTSPSQIAAGRLEELRKLLPDATLNVYSEVKPEPTIKQLDHLRKFIHNHNAEAVIGLGGGSVLDCTKAAAVLAYNPAATEEYFYQQKDIETSGAYCVLLPTTAGTGSECTPNAVFVDEETNIKQSLRSDYLWAKGALCDPELLDNTPRNVIAASGLDALTQAIESYISRRTHNAGQALSGRAVKLLWHNLASFHHNGDSASRDAVAEGSMLGAMAFAQTGLGAVHGLAHPIGALSHWPHGLVCGILLPWVLEWNRNSAEDNLLKLAEICGCKSIEQWFEQLHWLISKLDVPATLAGAQLSDVDLEFIIANCRSGSMACNPRSLSDDELRTLLPEVLGL